MIKRIDEMLKLWAEDLHGDHEPLPRGGSMIAMLIEYKGELIRGTRGSRILLDESVDIELIVNKHMDAQLAVVVREHYCNHDSKLTQKVKYCRCSLKTYYQRLHEAHECIAALLMRRAA